MENSPDDTRKAATNTSMPLTEVEGLRVTVQPRVPTPNSPAPATTDEQTGSSPPAPQAPPPSPPRTQTGSRSAAGSAQQGGVPSTVPGPGLVAEQGLPHPSPRLPEAPSPHCPTPTFFSSRTFSAKSRGLLDRAPGGCKLYFLKLRQPPPRTAPLPPHPREGLQGLAWLFHGQRRGGALEQRPATLSAPGPTSCRRRHTPRIQVLPLRAPAPPEDPSCCFVVSSGQEAGRHRRCLREMATRLEREPGGQQSPSG